MEEREWDWPGGAGRGARRKYQSMDQRQLVMHKHTDRLDQGDCDDDDDDDHR